MIIGIDLLWVRPNICGGTESVIRNLLNGFGMYDDKNEYLLFAGRDVAETFECYKEYPNMRIQICDVDSMKRVRRIAWENANLDKLARKLKVEIMLIPVYSKPNSLQEEKGGIPYITVDMEFKGIEDNSEADSSRDSVVQSPVPFHESMTVFLKDTIADPLYAEPVTAIDSEVCHNFEVEAIRVEMGHEGHFCIFNDGFLGAFKVRRDPSLLVLFELVAFVAVASTQLESEIRTSVEEFSVFEDENAVGARGNHVGLGLGWIKLHLAGRGAIFHSDKGVVVKGENPSKRILWILRLEA